MRARKFRNRPRFFLVALGADAFFQTFCVLGGFRYGLPFAKGVRTFLLLNRAVSHFDGVNVNRAGIFVAKSKVFVGGVDCPGYSVGRGGFFAVRSPRGRVRICRSVKRGFGSAELPLFPGGNFDRYRPNSAGQSFVVEYVTLLAVAAVHLNLVFISRVGINLARDFACGPVVPVIGAASRNGTPVKRHGFGRRGLNRYAGNRFFNSAERQDNRGRSGS